MNKGLKIGSIIIGVVLILGITLYVVMEKTNERLDTLPASSIDNAAFSTLRDGVFQGEYNAFPIEVVVDVTVKDQQINHIDLVKHVNGQGAAGKDVLEEVIAAQSLHVDLVSGATYSSKVILLAVEDALHESMGD